MITQKTAADLWHCYREIEAGKQLLQDMEKVEGDNPGRKHEQHLKDAFGLKQGLHLGIPMGEKGHQLFDLSPKLALSVIRAHIAQKKQELVEVNERARIELDSHLSISASALNIARGPTNVDMDMTPGSG
jgi:hypothetical protein